jgi:hypothetical protein
MAYKPKKLKNTFTYNEPLTTKGWKAQGRVEHARCVADREDTERRIAASNGINWSKVEGQNIKQAKKRAAK